MDDDAPEANGIGGLEDMIDMDPEARARNHLRILDGMLARAIKDQMYDSALKIAESARQILNRHGRK